MTIERQYVRQFINESETANSFAKITDEEKAKIRAEVIGDAKRFMDADELKEFDRTLKVEQVFYGNIICYYISGQYGESRVWGSTVYIYTNKMTGTIDTIAGFTRNPIGLVRNQENLTRGSIEETKLDPTYLYGLMMSEMEEAWHQHIKDQEAYKDYVIRTGDRS